MACSLIEIKRYAGLLVEEHREERKMARNRMIKPEFWEDEKVGQLSPIARLLFIGALNFADDEGLIRWNENYIAASVFPYDKLSNNKTKKLMKELDNLKIVEVFETKSHFFIARIQNFKKHQIINRPQPSKFLQEIETHLLKNQSEVEHYSVNSSVSYSLNHSVSIHGVKEVKEKLKEVEVKEEIEKERKVKAEFGQSHETGGTLSLSQKGDILPSLTYPYPSSNSKDYFSPEGAKPNDTTTANDTATTASKETDFISSTSVDTFKARVDYAISLGIDPCVARTLANFAQSEKFPLLEHHYRTFAQLNQDSPAEIKAAFQSLKKTAVILKKTMGVRQFKRF
jgi:hypothetical protein